jgi:hypothetical protein
MEIKKSRKDFREALTGSKWIPFSAELHKNIYNNLKAGKI